MKSVVMLCIYQFGPFYGHLVKFKVIFEISFPRFGMLYHENLATLIPTHRRPPSPGHS
jgi:hypothetical protein